MANGSYFGLLNNAVLLLALGVSYEMLGINRIQGRFLRRLVSGLLVGGISIAVMLTPWQLAPGIIFDTRWVVISLSGLFFGLIPTLIGGVMAILFRLFLGGDGAIIGSLTILSGGVIGLGWRYLQRRLEWPLDWLRLYLFSIVVELAVLGCMLLMPSEVRWAIIYAVAPPMLILFPLGSLLLGLLLIRQDQHRKAKRALAESQSRYQTIIESLDEVGEGLFIVGEDSRIEYMNQTMIRWFGDRTGEFCSDSVAALDNHHQYRRLVQSEGQGRSVYYRPESPDGRHFEIIGTPISNRDGSVSRLEVVRDVSGRKHNEEQIRTLSQVVEQSPVSVVITDTEGCIEYVNSTFEKISGYCAAEVIGQHTRILQSGKTPMRNYQELWRTIKSGGSWRGEFCNKKKSGELFWERAHIAPVLDEAGGTRHFLAVKEDITLHKAQEQRILQQAHFDGLTGLPNRFLSLDRLDQLTRDAGRANQHVAVLFLDLDDFKKVNDSLGHEVGDQLLVQAADRLSTQVRSSDTVGRLGGDEFIIMLGGLDEIDRSGRVAEQMLSQFHRPFNLDGRELVLTASLGVAIYPEDGANPAELLRNADTAMYCSKEAGRNTYHYYTESMNQGVARRLLLEEHLRGALMRGEFRLHYQPQIELASGRLIGTEALLRWNNPELGEVSPAEFIPIAEQTGLIVSIGEYVITESLAQLAQWQQMAEQPLRMAVNVSPRQFRDPALVPFIERTIKRTGVPAECLELEITEGVLMSGHSYVDIALSAINRLGVAIAMDDFGTGYSSLSYLRNYPFDILKIDRSFIDDVPMDEADRELVNATIAMAHGLGLKVVAEGVETRGQLDYLKAQRCDYAQGYLFSSAVPGEEIPSLLDNKVFV
ncbi:EAL domain-containing protein [Sedimenticola selenatireducens]|uniref:EAL domain-containing protein n=1 Tax=Sedimenticola selenatireducens TaxID=191960 RepID=UPI002AAC1A0E|nr:EAL domain-containing protein [Sedimenticola selenatireducens]